MQVLGFAGPGARTLCDRVAPHLDGRVAVVKRTDGVDGSQAGDGSLEGVAAAYRVGGDGDGAWSARGSDRGLGDVLDDLAATYDHALVVGFPAAAVPTVALGDADPEQVALSAETAADVDTEAILDAVADAAPHVTLDTLVEQVKASPRAHRAGAIATFTGRVRAKDGEEDPRTLELTFEKYEGVAEDRFRTIESDLMEREGVEEVVMFHRTGTLGAGEDIVFVVVLAGHREEAFETVSDGIDRLKDEVPIFKRETTVEEDFWVHDRE
ncbi:molybdopterin synthase [Halobellus salinus]|uniref:Molybdopterin synthase n=1 Tax=Halobellus salinus TaxID=931585 RepID=A0A830ECI3_9EURY|nr:molybdopterin synthase [Halobellus salinus]GGI96874.1 molybdopterin synthase [Halobellus salinus]SMP13578.1 molybdopterin synthase subunit MoaE /molybdopterin guanine dinucleotide biosynthesis accessory protein MobB [Halobellus salinus]